MHKIISNSFQDCLSLTDVDSKLIEFKKYDLSDKIDALIQLIQYKKIQQIFFDFDGTLTKFLPFELKPANYSIAIDSDIQSFLVKVASVASIRVNIVSNQKSDIIRKVFNLNHITDRVIPSCQIFSHRGNAKGVFGFESKLTRLKQMKPGDLYIDDCIEDFDLIPDNVYVMSKNNFSVGQLSLLSLYQFLLTMRPFVKLRKTVPHLSLPVIRRPRSGTF